MEKIRLGTNEDGTPHFLYHAPDEHVVITGSASGLVTLPDGSEVDVTDSAVVADSPEHAQAIAEAISANVNGPVEDAPTSKKKG